MTPLRCQGCGGSGCSWECEPCMHGDSACGTKCMDDLCRGSADHYDCDRCGGSGREPEWDDELKTYSERGFGQFLRDLPTTYGHRVSVYESSSASGPHLWLDVSGSSHLQGEPVPHAGIPFGVAEGSTTAHMTVEQAVAVRDAIDAWISEQNPMTTPPVLDTEAAAAYLGITPNTLRAYRFKRYPFGHPTAFPPPALRVAGGRVPLWAPAQLDGWKEARRMAKGEPPRPLVRIGGEPRIEVCDLDGLPYGEECPGRFGPMDHTFSEYGWHAKFHEECCPRWMDGNPCLHEHEGEHE